MRRGLALILWSALLLASSQLALAQDSSTPGTAVEAPQASTESPPALAFLPDGLVDDAIRFRSEVVASHPSEGGGLEALRSRGDRAAAGGDARASAQAYRAALALDLDDTATWLKLSHALLGIEAGNYSERYDLPRQAVAAAINGYRAASGPDARATALAGLAEALAGSTLYRPALEAYKASLALQNSPEVRSAYETLRKEHGFRVVNYSVDSDSASPRICIQFSEPLARLSDGYAQYVTVNERSPQAVEAEDEQICIEGVEHGERYRVTLRPGISSTVDEVLESPVALSVYVRDRSPSARFTGRNFVLPPVGQQTVPLVTVNTSQVALKLYRVGERALADIIGDQTFQSQLNSYSAGQIADQRGEILWSGVVDIKPQLNQEVTTGLPVEDMLKERTPGVYVITARPADSADRPWEEQATQWLVVSDIGLATYSGTDGLHVFTRSLTSAAPTSGVSLKLVALNNEVLATATTDDLGHALFPPGMVRGTGGNAPALVTASGENGDYGFIDLTAAAFDLSDRGVKGRAAPGALDVFLYTERGIYRAGDTVHVAALVRDATAHAVADTPLTLVVERPDGVEHTRILTADEGAGGHAHDLVLPGNAMRGTWHVRAYSDPKGPALADQAFLVEDFVPERMALDLEPTVTTMTPGEPAPIDVTGRYLYGAPAAGLKLDGDLVIRPVTTLKAWPDYSFGLAEEDAVPERQPLAGLPTTNEQGKARIDVVATALPTTTRPLEADVTMRLTEASGRAVERDVTLPVKPAAPLVGIKPLFSGDGVDQGGNAQFDVIAVDPDLKRTAAQGLTWQLLKLEQSFQWYQSDGSWRYEPVTFTRRVANGRIDVSADEPAHISVGVDWGRYRLEVSGDGPTAPATSVDFTAGWYVARASADTPDALEVSLDKDSYRPGETATLSIESRFAGLAMVTVMGEKLISMTPVEVPADGTTVELPVTEEWGAGAYVTAALHRPADAQEKRMPARALGLAWLKRDMSGRTLDVALDISEPVRPNSAVEVPVTVSGAAEGERVYLTLAAVDVGILNLTRYTAPDPVGWYYGQRRLGVEIRDIYGQLIDAMRGTPGTVRSGGGAGGLSMEGSPPTQELVTRFSGIVEADAQGRATVTLDLPQFNGTVRFMAVAWTRDAVGRASRDVVVRDPVVVTASVPRFMAPDDEAQLTLEIDNREAPAGDYQLAIVTSDGLTASQAEQTVSLTAQGRQTLAATIAAKELGDNTVTVRLAGQGLDLKQTLNLPVRPASAPVSDRKVVSLAADGGTLTLTPDVLGDRIGRDAHVSVSVMQSGALDVPALLYALDRFPYGCAEQITSRALPLLYLSQVAAGVGLAGEAAAQERVAKAITQVLGYQASNGSFGLWAPGSDDLWLDAYVGDFLTRAREQGYDVPDLAFTQAVDFLQNALAYAPEVKGNGEDVAYALYVLARNRRAAVGDLRYYADAKLDDFGSPLAKAQVGAALALYGERERAKRAFDAAIAGLRKEEAAANTATGRSDYGSPLRDGAATLALLAEAAPVVQPEPALVRFVSDVRSGTEYTSTQEDAWLLMAAHGLMAGSRGLALDIDGTAVSGALFRRYDQADLADKPVTIANRSQEPLQAVLTVTGVPETPLPAGGNGFTIKRTYYTLAGETASVDEVSQNDRFIVVIEVTEETAQPSRVLVSDRLPAGFEIDNPALVESADLSAFSWLPEVSPAHTEFRDDEFVAAFDRGPNDDRTITLAYVVRAVTPGHYVHPAAMVEDMYRPELSARTDHDTVEIAAPTP